MKCVVLVVIGSKKGHELLTDKIRVITLKCAFEVGVDHALLLDFLLHIVVDELGVVLGADTCE